MLAHLTRQLLGWLGQTFLPADFFDCWVDEDDEP